MDPLSDVLRVVRLDAAHFCLVRASAPFSVVSVPARDLEPPMFPRAAHLISYHILVSGTCWGGLDEKSQVRMQPGDVIVFPHGDGHIMSSAEGLVGTNKPAWPHRYPETVYIGAGTDATIVCGYLGCDVTAFNPLLASLPRCMLVPGIGSGFLSQFPRQVVAESRGPRAGSQTMLTRMAELLFIEVARYYVEHLPPAQTGWLAGLNHPVVGPALLRLHEDPAYPWTLAKLACAISASRSVLAERFSTLVGVPPMLYLMRWRLQLAAEQLGHSSAKVAAIGMQVGYESEAAFSRAFKRDMGQSPTAWRRARQGTTR
jgi:AraC-like DNA-binding protein